MVNVKVLCKGSKYYSKKSDKDIAMIERLVNKVIEKVENGFLIEYVPKSVYEEGLNEQN